MAITKVSDLGGMLKQKYVDMNNKHGKIVKRKKRMMEMMMKKEYMKYGR